MMDLEKLPNQQVNEKVEIFMRRHWIDLVRIAANTVGLLLVPAFVGVVISVTGVNIVGQPILGPLALVIFSVYLLLVSTLTLTSLTDYWLDVWVVTNERIINSEQLGLFNRVVSEVKLEQIQDITSEQKGFLETFLTFGDVYIQTAAERERFQFKNIDNPDDIKIKIGSLTNTCQVNHHHEHPPLFKKNEGEKKSDRIVL